MLDASKIMLILIFRKYIRSNLRILEQTYWALKVIHLTCGLSRSRCQILATGVEEDKTTTDLSSFHSYKVIAHNFDGPILVELVTNFYKKIGHTNKGHGNG